MLRKLIADHNPQCIAAAFDLSGPTFRSELRDDYKANRAPMPSDLAEQIAFVHKACEALGVKVLTFTGFEADDVIGTLAMRAVADGRPVAIVTGDKDFFQLVDDATGVRVFNPRDEGAWYDAEGVKTKFGVAPEQVVDVLALMGDSIDNIKGVPGIGEKGARDLISTHGSLDALLANAPSLGGKKRELLTTHADSARESRVLLRIRTDVPLPDCRHVVVSTTGDPTGRSVSSCSRHWVFDRSSPSTRRPPTRSTQTTPSSRRKMASRA